MGLVWQIGAVVFAVAICFVAVRGIRARRAQTIRRRLIYGPKKVKRKDKAKS
jgi:hypothetical protein